MSVCLPVPEEPHPPRLASFPCLPSDHSSSSSSSSSSNYLLSTLYPTLTPPSWVLISSPQPLISLPLRTSAGSSIVIVHFGPIRLLLIAWGYLRWLGPGSSSIQRPLSGTQTPTPPFQAT
ncbi:hypothetical protein BO70DRAFT_136652 [Aspergillus heteromorphus CBS 117.55]|uniref:Uncharacterized protein n=1 Tax=Aspergillus heteromorphus CBS 117.55 TaxID=1448321 RepID=A0A317WV25_9EURO|nr:uncharacterized protein BO70DRAFT_136652 [Aspergillus heteromorphus CBS 117.55]PWY90206.1 hypothetical protein BO70DRAFT_136652 [Aspergillus heteromorphus CBS 117.55]